MEHVSHTGGRLRLALGLTLAVLVIEFAGGLLSHSLALLSDAGHVLTDVFALGLAWFAVEQSHRPADHRRSYGYQRVGILAALLSSVTLVVIGIAIAVEAVRRLLSPEPVQGGIVVATALAAIAITAEAVRRLHLPEPVQGGIVVAYALAAIATNTFVILTLRSGARSMKVSAVLFHVTGDVAASVGVVVGGIVILLTGWLYIDPILSLAIAALIAYGAWGIVRETMNLLMEGTPADIDVAAVKTQITKTPKVTGVHDL